MKSNMTKNFEMKKSLRNCYKDGGMVHGPGGPTADKVPAKLSAGEYVLPADTVKHVGKHHLDRLVSQTHKPVVQKMNKLRHYADGGYVQPMDDQDPNKQQPQQPAPQPAALSPQEQQAAQNAADRAQAQRVNTIAQGFNTPIPKVSPTPGIEVGTASQAEFDAAKAAQQAKLAPPEPPAPPAPEGTVEPSTKLSKLRSFSDGAVNKGKDLFEQVKTKLTPTNAAQAAEDVALPSQSASPVIRSLTSAGQAVAKAVPQLGNLKGALRVGGRAVPALGGFAGEYGDLQDVLNDPNATTLDKFNQGARAVAGTAGAVVGGTLGATVGAASPVPGGAFIGGIGGGIGGQKLVDSGLDAIAGQSPAERLRAQNAALRNTATSFDRNYVQPGTGAKQYIDNLGNPKVLQDAETQRVLNQDSVARPAYVAPGTPARVMSGPAEMENLPDRGAEQRKLIQQGGLNSGETVRLGNNLYGQADKFGKLRSFSGNDGEGTSTSSNLSRVTVTPAFNADEAADANKVAHYNARVRAGDTLTPAEQADYNRAASPGGGAGPAGGSAADMVRAALRNPDIAAYQTPRLLEALLSNETSVQNARASNAIALLNAQREMFKQNHDMQLEDKRFNSDQMQRSSEMFDKALAQPVYNTGDKPKDDANNTQLQTFVRGSIASLPPSVRNGLQNPQNAAETGQAMQNARAHLEMNNAINDNSKGMLGLFGGTSNPNWSPVASITKTNANDSFNGTSLYQQFRSRWPFTNDLMVRLQDGRRAPLSAIAVDQNGNFDANKLTLLAEEIGSSPDKLRQQLGQIKK